MVSLSDGLPVAVSSLGAVCLCRMVCHSSSGEGVGCVAVAVSSFGAGCLCRMVSLWDWLPVVSTLDTLPAVSLWDWLPWSVPSIPCQPVNLCRGLCVDGLPVVAGMCCLWPVDWWPWSLSVWDVLPVVSFLDTLPAVLGVCVGW